MGEQLGHLVGPGWVGSGGCHGRPGDHHAHEVDTRHARLARTRGADGGTGSEGDGWACRDGPEVRDPQAGLRTMGTTVGAGGDTGASHRRVGQGAHVLEVLGTGRDVLAVADDRVHRQDRVARCDADGNLSACCFRFCLLLVSRSFFSAAQVCKRLFQITILHLHICKLINASFHPD